jgi:hypothetical protein
VSIKMYNTKKNLGTCTPTSCPKAGIKIHDSNNDYKKNPFEERNARKDIQNTKLSTLDLDLDHYELEDLLNLFNMDCINETNLKNAKQIVLKMHPDKSKLDTKYFLFFSGAYKRIYGVYEFQNKSSNKKYKDEDFYDESNVHTLNHMFEKNKKLKDPNNFNAWFNNQFEKHKLEDDEQHGYGDWLKSNDGIIDINENVTKSNMNEIFERQKKHIQSITLYQGISDSSTSTLGGSLLMSDGNFSSSGGSLEYTDLKQAYTETVIPVTMEDYEKMPKFRNVNEYKNHRESIDTKPLTKEEAEAVLMKKQQGMDKDSAALAYKYAKQAEKVKEKDKSFWSDIRLITGW